MLVTIDWGALHEGYCSDCTRTYATGERISARAREIYELVLAAQEQALAAVRAGPNGKELDAVARELIEAAGQGEHFGHGLGHGVGIEIHEGPRLSRLASEDPLLAGNVVTVEPGVYLPGRLGVRIEDLVVVSEGRSGGADAAVQGADRHLLSGKESRRSQRASGKSPRELRRVQMQGESRGQRHVQARKNAAWASAETCPGSHWKLDPREHGARQREHRRTALLAEALPREQRQDERERVVHGVPRIQHAAQQQQQRQQQQRVGLAAARALATASAVRGSDDGDDQRVADVPTHAGAVR